MVITLTQRYKEKSMTTHFIEPIFKGMELTKARKILALLAKLDSSNYRFLSMVVVGEYVFVYFYYNSYVTGSYASEAGLNSCSDLPPYDVAVQKLWKLGRAREITSDKDTKLKQLPTVISVIKGYQDIYNNM